MQLFEQRHDLPADASLDALASWDALPTALSVIHRLATGHVAPEALHGNELVIRFRCCLGLAWAIRRELPGR